MNAPALPALPPTSAGEHSRQQAGQGGWAPFMVRQQPRVTFAGPDLEHQIVITGQGGISVSCTCLRRELNRRAGGELNVIATQSCWQPGEAIAAWRRWHQ